LVLTWPAATPQTAVTPRQVAEAASVIGWLPDRDGDPVMHVLGDPPPDRQGDADDGD
jgi:hypothetical protein